MKSLDKKLQNWTDEECLTEFSKFLKERVSLSSQFIVNKEGLISHQVVTIMCGDKAFFSEPRELGWPLQQMPVPDALKNKAH